MESSSPFFITIGSLSAGSVPFVTNSYNFRLPGGGGGSSATLNGQNVEMF